MGSETRSTQRYSTFKRMCPLGYFLYPRVRLSRSIRRSTQAAQALSTVFRWRDGPPCGGATFDSTFSSYRRRRGISGSSLALAKLSDSRAQSNGSETGPPHICGGGHALMRFDSCWSAELAVRVGDVLGGKCRYGSAAQNPIQNNGIELYVDSYSHRLGQQVYVNYEHPSALVEYNLTLVDIL